MIASIFVKVLGKLLDNKLSSWAERCKLRVPSQVGFRARFTTLDHMLFLRVLEEKARRSNQPLFCMFVDFSKAFDKVPRKKLWERMVSLQVPLEMRVAIAKLYQKVLIKFSMSSSDEVLSTLFNGNVFGLLGCPAT